MIGDMNLEDEHGNVIEAMQISIAEIIRLIDNNISENELKKTFCLQFIDPYGDTMFNLLQIGVLKKEFEYLSENCQENKEKEKLKSIVGFISKAEKLHTFVKFYGD